MKHIICFYKRLMLREWWTNTCSDLEKYYLEPDKLKSILSAMNWERLSSLKTINRKWVLTENHLQQVRTLERWVVAVKKLRVWSSLPLNKETFTLWILSTNHEVVYFFPRLGHLNKKKASDHILRMVRVVFGLYIILVFYCIGVCKQHLNITNYA